MKFVHFDQVNNTIAKNQEGYNPIPVYENMHIAGHPHVMCIELDDQERAEFLKTGKIFFTQYLAAMPAFPPILSTTLNPFTNNISLGATDPIQQAIEDLGRRIKMIVKACNLDKESFAYHLQIISIQGAASATDLKMFASFGIPIYDALSNVMGISQIKVNELAIDRQITSKNIVNAIEYMTNPGGVFEGF